MPSLTRQSASNALRSERRLRNSVTASTPARRFANRRLTLNPDSVVRQALGTPASLRIARIAAQDMEVTPSPQASDATSTSHTMPYPQPEVGAEQDTVVVPRIPYIPPLVDVGAFMDAKRWTVNDFIETMRSDEYPPMLFNDIYNQTIEDLKLVTQKARVGNIGPKNQVHYTIQRIWARIAHICLTRMPMGAVCYGEDSAYHDDSNLINTHMWHIFQNVDVESTSLAMDRVLQVVSDNTYSLRHKLIDFETGMDIISSYDVNGTRSILMTVGQINVDMYIANTNHPCPFCGVPLDLDILKFEEEVKQDMLKMEEEEKQGMCKPDQDNFEHHKCRIQGSELCMDTPVAVGHLPCPHCKPENVQICRFCMPQFIMKLRY